MKGVRVVSVRELPERADVFNLQVEECPEFFANGILVHNCRYVVAEVDGLGSDPTTETIISNERAMIGQMT